MVRDADQTMNIYIEAICQLTMASGSFLLVVSIAAMTHTFTVGRFGVISVTETLPCKFLK
jgi:hypothetical protein